MQVVARVMGAPTVQQTIPPPQPPMAGQAWNTPSPTANLTPEERARIAAEAAAQIAGKSPKPAMNTSGCGPMFLFVCLLPWSLILLPMPGGIRNKNAGKILGFIFVVCLVLGIVSLIVAYRTIGPSVMKLIPQVKDSYNVPDG